MTFATNLGVKNREFTGTDEISKQGFSKSTENVAQIFLFNDPSR